ATGAGFSLDVTLTAAGSPRWFGRKHFDQPMRATGMLRVDGEDLRIDCQAMRDRSWYSRSDFGLFRSAYSYFLTEELEILALSVAPPDGDRLAERLPVVGGYCRRRGANLSVVGGERWVSVRGDADGHPAEIHLKAQLSDGAVLSLTGSGRNSMAIACNTAMFSWMTLVAWEHEGARYLGEDQEIWTPQLWRRFRSAGTPWISAVGREL